jgi:hypothetical protein
MSGARRRSSLKRKQGESSATPSYSSATSFKSLMLLLITLWASVCSEVQSHQFRDLSESGIKIFLPWTRSYQQLVVYYTQGEEGEEGERHIHIYIHTHTHIHTYIQVLSNAACVVAAPAAIVRPQSVSLFAHFRVPPFKYNRSIGGRGVEDC